MFHSVSLFSQARGSRALPSVLFAIVFANDLFTGSALDDGLFTEAVGVNIGCGCTWKSTVAVLPGELSLVLSDYKKLQWFKAPTVASILANDLFTGSVLDYGLFTEAVGMIIGCGRL